MKNLFFTISVLLLALSCKAQSPVLALDTYYHEIPDGAYVKDLNNELNKFVGTWLFTNGTTSFTLVLQKHEQTFNDDYYQDYLVGEYAYVGNGLTIVNTIPTLNNTQLSLDDRNIGGRYVVKGPDHNCTDCLANERRIDLYFSDPNREYLSTGIVLRYLVNENNPEKITSTIYVVGNVMLPYEGASSSPSVPYGTYLMEKQ
ncbi:hypothetical protein ES692_08760 [Psychroserpens burtonensis]|uniref:DUF6705 domain-containing protein n=1 Tax=Psychroserpens burtonensis TaxID=49278 RepID=A0A5C7BBM3_9FLAO|nr:DUF6705 family protein [Psychroserpens burtonensis]TXE17645.1 hypothetical protein ES692_08760 [Psychroserpens burtonensis]